jgi:hypothetical protein
MKKNIVTRISGQSIGIQQGSQVLFSDFANNGDMWTGRGDRETRHQIEFAEVFHGAPAVMVGISLWDTDHQTNMRANIAADEITAHGFVIVFRTWGDTRIARIRADWTAIGALRDDDDWDVR